MARIMTYATWIPAFLAAAGMSASAQYIGYVYPAGGSQGAKFHVTMGGQQVEGVNRVLVTGEGVKARVFEYNKRMNPQEVQLLREQRDELRRLPAPRQTAWTTNVLARLDKLIADWVNQPACSAISNLIVAELEIAPDAEPGPREIRVISDRGLSNPMAFHVGQLPEFSGPPLPTSHIAILGKEGDSLRRKSRSSATADASMMTMTMMADEMSMVGEKALSDLDDDEICVTVPCVVNGQISSGTVDRFRFTAKKGQRLVIQSWARDLVPYMADAVPGWFQPVMALFDAGGAEIAFVDDYRFHPDPVILCEIPADGEYVLIIHDAIYRGREDFVYRISIGETPFITSIFPSGGRVGVDTEVKLKGWNLPAETMVFSGAGKEAGVYPLVVKDKAGRMSNRIPFALDDLPETRIAGDSASPANPHPVKLPVMINGRIERPGDRRAFKFEGKAGESVVAEVIARRLDSPLDSVLVLSDASGTPMAFNDDWEDPGIGLNTHHADSYIRATLPSNGVYTVHLREAQHRGGEKYVYRLRISPPRPDFELRTATSRLSFRNSKSVSIGVHILPRDGFASPVEFMLKDPPPGYELSRKIQSASLTVTQSVAWLSVRTTLDGTNEPVRLTIAGVATNAGHRIVRRAVPAEDRMQAFLWRHLAPAEDLKAIVFNPPPKPPDPPKPGSPAQVAAATPPKPAVPPPPKTPVDKPKTAPVTKPTETKPASPAKPKPAEAKPAEPKPAVTKPVDAKPSIPPASVSPPAKPSEVAKPPTPPPTKPAVVKPPTPAATPAPKSSEPAKSPPAVKPVEAPKPQGADGAGKT